MYTHTHITTETLLTSYWFIHTVTASTYFSLSLFLFYSHCHSVAHNFFAYSSNKNAPFMYIYIDLFHLLMHSFVQIILCLHFSFCMHLTSTSSRHCPHCALINSTLHAPIHPFTPVRHCMYSACVIQYATQCF